MTGSFNKVEQGEIGDKEEGMIWNATGGEHKLKILIIQIFNLL